MDRNFCGISVRKSRSFPEEANQNWVHKRAWEALQNDPIKASVISKHDEKLFLSKEAFQTFTDSFAGNWRLLEVDFCLFNQTSCDSAANKWFQAPEQHLQCKRTHLQCRKWGSQSMFTVAVYWAMNANCCRYLLCSSVALNVNQIFHRMCCKFPHHSLACSCPCEFFAEWTPKEGTWRSQKEIAVCQFSHLWLWPTEVENANGRYKTSSET